MWRLANWAKAHLAGMSAIGKRRAPTRAKRHGRALRLEPLETRSLLSATVVSAGTAIDYSLSNANVAVTLAAAVPANETAIVEIASDPTSVAVSVTDDRGNVYSQDVHVTNAGQVELWVFSAPMGVGLAPGDHIIAHFAGAPPRAKAVSALAVGGLVRANKLDLTASGAGTNKAPNSGATGATGHANELLIGAIGAEGPRTDAFAPGAGYTLVGRAGSDTGGPATNVTISPEFRIVSATGQYNADGTLSVNRSWVAAIATYAIATAPVVVQPADQANTEGDSVSLQIAAGDSDGDSLTYGQSGLPPGLSINASTGLITGEVHTTFADHGPYSVTVTATDPSGFADAKSFVWNVTNVAPTAIDHSFATSADTSLVLLAPGALAGSSDPGEESLHAVLDADVTHGSLTLNADGSFTYTPDAGFLGVDSFTYHASDGAADSNVATVTLNVAEFLPPAVTPTGDQTNQENDSVHVQVVAVDPDGDTLLYAAVGLPAGLSIDPSTGLISGVIAGSAADHAPFHVDVLVIDGNLTVHDPFTWTVHNVAPALTAYDVALVQGISSTPATVAAFTDVGGPEPIGNYASTIDWGDGTSASAGTISQSSGVFTVQGSHVYTSSTSGVKHYTVTVTVRDDNGFSVVSSTATSNAVVSDPAVAASGGFQVAATEGLDSGTQTVATFVDPGGARPIDDYSASIDWGDGTAPAPGLISFDSFSGIFIVQGAHTYAEESPPGTPYPIVVTLSHDPAPQAVAVSEADVSDPPVIASGGFTITATAGIESELQTVATFVDPAGAEPISRYSASIDWGDGTSATLGTIVETNGTFTVQGSHLYAATSAMRSSDALSSDLHSIRVAIQHQTAPGAEAVSAAEVTHSPNQSFIAQVYFDFLDRPVDPASLAYWTDLLAAGQSRQQIVLQIEQAREYAEVVVEQLYQRYLHRDADAAGLNYLATLMQQGATIEQLSAILAGSNEFFAAQGGGTIDGFLNAVYEDALGRPIDPAGLAWWKFNFALGLTRAQVVAQILGRQEYRQDVVKQAYLHLLHRPADPAGLNNWTAALNSGSSDQLAYASIAGSQEYFDQAQT